MMQRPVDALTFDELTRHSVYVAEALRHWPGAVDEQAPAVPERPDSEAMAADPLAALRRFRQLATVALLWRELGGEIDLPTFGAKLSALASDCLNLALARAEASITERHGQLLDADGAPIRLSIIGLGKLGGEELNFNSDIDVVFVYRGEGRSTGPRRLDAGAWCSQVARELIRLMDTLSPSGRVWAMDARLRPFGDAGPLAWSVSAMETYFLGEGRTWERYAWLKARCVAGDLSTGQALLEQLQPFIYRRYLDYGIFASLRELHHRIDRSGRQEKRRHDIKRGPGGIRELEFLIQSLQLLRGGRDRQLRVSGFLPALEAAAGAGLINAAEADEIAGDYGFLRILENRLQAVTGRQTQQLPDHAEPRAALARLMAADGWDSLATEIDSVRERVQQRFQRQFAEPDEQAETSPWPPEGNLQARLAESGFEAPAEAADLLTRLDERIGRRPLSAEGRRRLERLLPRLLAEAGQHQPPDTGFADLIALVEAIARRSAYLALLSERPRTLERLVRVFRLSHRVAGWIIASPQLLDDLLDPVHGFDLPEAPRTDPSDPETSLDALSRWRHSGHLRTALAELDERMAVTDVGVRLSHIAETVVGRVLDLITGHRPDLAVIGYGNLGARSLHYESDLDLVFLHADEQPPLRTAQRLISHMQLPLPGGRMFTIDTRLRPNGQAGLLVSRMEQFADYQRRKAWTWEHQALIRARWVAGDDELKRPFEQLRRDLLCQPREPDRVARDLASMRRKQRSERKEDPVKRLLTDIQFIAEKAVLCLSHRHPALSEQTGVVEQLEHLARIDSEFAADAPVLGQYFAELSARRHNQWLYRQPDPPAPEAIDSRLARIWQQHFPD